MSPAVNDPTTAVNCIQYLQAVFEHLAHRALPSAIHHAADGSSVLVARSGLSTSTCRPSSRSDASLPTTPLLTIRRAGEEPTMFTNHVGRCAKRSSWVSTAISRLSLIRRPGCQRTQALA
jgi:hypothetical protein